MRIVAFEYNPQQVDIKARCGGIHTANTIQDDGTFKVEPNSNGWNTICFGMESQIGGLTYVIQPLIYDISEELGKPVSATIVKEIIETIYKIDTSVSMIKFL